MKTAEKGYNEYYALIHILLNMGEEMYKCGAEINRIEDTLSRMGRAYGAAETNVLAITTSIVITMRFEDNYHITETRRMLKSPSNDYTKLEKYNAISRRCCKTAMPLNELREMIDDAKKPMSALKFFLGGVLATSAFTIFFGGTLKDAAVAAVFALLICLGQKYAFEFCPNNATFNLLMSFVGGVCICLTVRAFPSLNMDKIIIGDIMLLIPGAAITNAVRDIIVGDVISGTFRMLESLLWAAGIAIGFLLAILLAGRGI